MTDRNKNKPAQRYLQFLPHIVLGDFEYVAVKQSHRTDSKKLSEFAITDKLKYDNYTGKRIRKKQSLSDLFPDDNEDLACA